MAPFSLVFRGLIKSLPFIRSHAIIQDLIQRIPRTVDHSECGCARKGGRRRALLVACCYKNSPHKSMHLQHSCKDVYTMRDVLYRAGWKPEEIQILAECDEKGHDFQGKKPTWSEIRKQLRLLVRGVQPGDFPFLHMSGHAAQQRARTDRLETDGKDEYFIPCDYFAHMSKKRLQKFEKTGRFGTRKAKILDNYLRKTIIDPLPCGAKLVAIIDCCAGTMLDLPVECQAGDRISYPKLLKFVASKAEIARRSIRELLFHPFRQPRVGIPMLLPLSANAGNGVSELFRYGGVKGTVMSISACHDGKQTFETREGGLLVTTLADILNNQTNGSPISNCELRRRLETSFEKYHEQMKGHFEAEGRKWDDAWKSPPVPQFCFSHEFIENDYFILAN